MADLLQRLVRCPVVVAPMAGGPSTAGLVLAASAAGALGFLAPGDTSRMNLWAGEGYHAATTRPAAEIVAMLADGTG